MADSLNDFLSSVPTYDQIINNAPTQPAGPPAGTPSGTGNWLTAGLGSGFYGTLGALGQGGEAAARAVGASDTGDKLAAWAKGERDTAATYARPDLEKGSWLDPATFGYRIAQGLPSMAGVLGGAALATIGAPEAGTAAAAGALSAGARSLIGGTLAGFPLAAGENIQRARDENQPVGQGTAIKALALGAPEAALQAALPAVGEGMLAGRIGSSAFKPFGNETLGKAVTGAVTGGAIQLPVGAAGEALMQQMGDPNRSFADRSQAIVDAALSGGIQGAFFGGAIHALAKKPPNTVTNNDLLQIGGLADPNAGQTVSSTGVPDQARLAPPNLQLPSPDAPGMQKMITDQSPPERGGVAAGDVVVPPAQPGQAIRQLPAPPERVNRPAAGEVIPMGNQSPPPLGLPAPTPEAPDTTRRAGSGEVIQGRQLHQGEIVEPTPPAQLTDQGTRFQAARDERVSRPASDDDPVITPPPDKVKQVADAAAIVAKAKRGVTQARLGDPLDVQSALFDHVRNTLAAQKAPFEPTDVPDILGPRMTKAAKAAGVLDDGNNLVDPWAKDAARSEAEASADQKTVLPDTEPDQANPPPARVQKDPNWSASRKTAFDRLEALRASIPDNTSDLHTQVSDLQSQLAKPGKGGVGGIITATKTLADAVKGQQAVDTARGVESTTNAAPTPGADETRGAGKFEADPAQSNPQTNPVTVTPKATAPDMGPVKKALVGVRNTLGKMMNAKLPKGQDKPYQATLDKIDMQTRAAAAAVKSGDLSKIGEFPKISDEAYEQMTVPEQKAVDDHMQAVKDLQDKINDASGFHPASGDAFASRERTPHDEAIGDLIDKGATMRQLLEHIAKNGSNTVRRTMAQRMLARSKADGSVRFGSLDEARQDHPTLRNVYGDYNGKTGETRLFDGADAEHTLLHEFAHAASLKALNDPTFRAKITSAMDAARKQMTDQEAAHPSMKNEEEFLAHAMSNPDFASLLDGMNGPEAQRSVWQTIKSAVGRFFGWPQSGENLLDHVEHLAGEATRMTNDANTVPGIEHNLGLYARSAQDYGEEIKRAFNEKVDPKGVGSNLFRRVLFWRTTNDIATGSAEHLPSGVRKVQDNADMRNYENTLNSTVARGDDLRRSLSKKEQALLDQLEMVPATGVDPRRGVKAHTWLSDAQKVARGPAIQKGNALWAEAMKGDGKVAKVFTERNNSNRAQLAASLYAMGKNAVENSGLKIKVDDAMARLNSDEAGIKHDPAKAAEYWHGKLTELKAVVDKYTSRVQAEISTADNDAKKEQLRAHISLAQDWAADASRHLGSMDQAPNFAVRRFGDQWVAGKLLDRSPEAIQKLADAFKAAGHGDVHLDHNVANDQIYMRTNGVTRAQGMKDVLNKMAAAGIIDPKSIKSDKVGTMDQNFAGLSKYARAQLKSFEDFMPKRAPEGSDPDTAHAYDQAREKALADLRSQLLDLTPTSDASKIFAERMGVQGASTDMGKAFLDRGSNTSRMIAQLSKTRDMVATNKGIRDEVARAVADPNMSVAQQNKIKAAANEIFLRDAQRQWKIEKSPFDGIRKLTHFFELSLSVPYTLALQSQTWSLGHAELTKYFGALASAKAIARAALPTLDAMKRTFSNDQPNSVLKDIAKAGSNRWAFVMTPEKLKGMSAQMASDLIKMDNLGAHNTSQTQWVYDGTHHHDGVMRQLHDVSSASTLYSEMNPRINTELAALELYRQREAQGNAPRGKEWTDAHTFALHVVRQSQLDWSPDNQPRAFGKHGVAGPASPLIAQFQGFRGKILEKMHREFADAFGARGPEYQSQARKFLMMHMATQAVLAGSMGLPAVSMLAGVYDKLADAFTGDHTHDIRASYRGWLSHVFGNTAGEALAHGVTRLGGVDLGEHLGEDRLLPLTDLMTNKRKLEDAYGDWLQQAAGSAAHMGYKMAKGARDMTNGDYLKGVSAFMPEMIRNALEAEQTAKYGYEDKSGFKYPGGPPTSQDIAAKAMGFMPADEANYTEKEQIVEGQEARQEYDKSNVMTHLAKSFNRQDPQAYQDWVQHSTNYMATHPGMMPPAAEFGAYLQEHMRSAALAGVTGAPLNTNIRDLISRGMVSYGNAGDK